jgi:hypothetical protein
VIAYQLRGRVSGDVLCGAFFKELNLITLLETLGCHALMATFPTFSQQREGDTRQRMGRNGETATTTAAGRNSLSSGLTSAFSGSLLDHCQQDADNLLDVSNMILHQVYVNHIAR